MKRYLTVVLLIMATLTMNAQGKNEPEKKKFISSLGLGGSFVVGSDAHDIGSSFAYKLGVLYEWQAYKDIYVIPGIEAISKSCKISLYDNSISKVYLQIPVYAAYKFDLTKHVKPLSDFETFDIVGKIGPYFAFGLFGTQIEELNGAVNDIFDSHNRFDAGIIMGLGVDIGEFVAGFELSRGFAKITDLKMYNLAFGVTLAYKF